MTSVHVHYSTVVAIKPTLAKTCSLKINEIFVVEKMMSKKNVFSLYAACIATCNAHCAFHTVLSFILVSHSVYSALFYNRFKHCVMLNKAWIPERRISPDLVACWRSKHSIKSHLDLFSKGISRWICMFLLWYCGPCENGAYIIRSTLPGQKHAPHLWWSGLYLLSLPDSLTYTHMHSVWQ